MVAFYNEVSVNFWGGNKRQIDNNTQKLNLNEITVRTQVIHLIISKNRSKGNSFNNKDLNEISTREPLNQRVFKINVKALENDYKIKKVFNRRVKGYLIDNKVTYERNAI